MTDTAPRRCVAAIAGVLAGRAWAAAGAAPAAERPSFRALAHYTHGLHYLSAGQLELAHQRADQGGPRGPRRRRGAAGPGEPASARPARWSGRSRCTRACSPATTSPAPSAPTPSPASARTSARPGFLDRAATAFHEVLEADPRNIHALIGLAEAPRGAAPVARGLRGADPPLAAPQDGRQPGPRPPAGRDGSRRRCGAGQREGAERAFRTALSLDRRVFPAHLGLADLCADSDPRPRGPDPRGRDRGGAGARLPRLRAPGAGLRGLRRALALRRPLRAHHPPGPARLARAARPGAPRSRDEGKPAEALGLLLRALESNPQVLLLHLEIWRTLRVHRPLGPEEQRLRGHRRGLGVLRRPARLHRLPLPRRRHAVALPALPRVEHLRRGARGTRRGGRA